MIKFRTNRSWIEPKDKDKKNNHFDEIRKTRERDTLIRLAIVVPSTLIVFWMLLFDDKGIFISKKALLFPYSNSSLLLTFGAALVAIVAMARMALIYLKPKIPAEDEAYTYDLINYIDLKVGEIAAKNKYSSNVSEEDKQEAFALLRKSVFSDASADILEEIKKSLNANSEKDEIRNGLQLTRIRLSQEIEALAKRGNVNLILGMTTAFFGLTVLTLSVLMAPQTGSDTYFFQYFIPRFTLAVVIELLSFFFLKLYKQTLSEIKYFQNEMTNCESKAMAVTLASQSENSTALAKVIELFATTERNFVLQKGQTTVELERERLNGVANVSTVQSLTSLLEKKLTTNK
ncbi:hypothetical protein [Xanthomonas arboricola]|uniref:hypothetical protein n=1 Tax=Xanthomonas arboricola TaxID=56448 RepID=UPI001290647C|nr:hypothetical protein [Xanthomonas arboricola]